jgi:plastocyanin
MHHFAVRFVLLAALVLMGSTFGLAQYGGGTGGGQAPAPNGVNIENFEFNPNILTVPVGTKVTWKNLDGATHTATSRSGVFNTGNLSRNQEGAHIFDKAGSFDYFCQIHPNMTGTIVVSGEGQSDKAAKFGASITREQEVPAPAALGANQSPASGMAYFELSADEKELFYNLTYTTMTGNITAAHFHKAKKGEAGGVVRLICGGNSPCPNGTGAFVFGTWKNSDAQPLSAEMVKALKDGELYVNLHTSANVSGEIRGQIAPASFVAAINREQEVPAPAALGANQAPAYGSAFFELNTEGTELKFSITYTTMTGNITAAHFHRAKASTAGPVVKLICGGQSNACPSGPGATLIGSWKSSDAQPLTSDLVKAIREGEIYVNIHTQVNPGGEIRGQLR